jgi:prevent-host-death family protein
VATWQLQEAKSRLSERIENAHSERPQIITRHGAEPAVVRSIRDDRAPTAS